MEGCFEKVDEIMGGEGKWELQAVELQIRKTVREIVHFNEKPLETVPFFHFMIK